jgi:4,5:9,10-diseco-3-hydroxy-5,9,17-trioxoandrosta-1(10),2-diene-4-oate hydrolase
MKHKNNQQKSRLAPFGATEKFIELGSDVVRLLVGGEKNGRIPVVLIHGGGTDNASISWYKFFEPLSQRRQVFAVDLPGFGLTTVEPLGGADKMADFVVQVMKMLSVETAHVCGVSMGGDVALNIALRYPSFPQSLILIAPGGLTQLVKNQFMHKLAWIGTKMPDWLLFPLSRLANKFVKSVLRQIVNNPQVLPEEVIEEFYREAQKPKAGMGYARYNQATIGYKGMKNNLLELVNKINIPALFFHGKQDPMVDINDSIAAAKQMPQARIVEIDNCGHWVQLEVPDIFNREALLFLEEVEKAEKVV